MNKRAVVIGFIVILAGLVVWFRGLNYLSHREAP